MMLPGLERWRQQFDEEPVRQLDRLIRGLVPLGSAGMLRYGEMFDQAFDSGDETLDGAVVEWLESHILEPLPPGMIPSCWADALNDLFRGIADQQLAETGRLLREEYERLRAWLQPLYHGPGSDPELAYLLALAFSQDDQRFSPLWRRLVLGQELHEEAQERRGCDVGLLGMRKMPQADGRPQSGVPDALLKALVLLAECDWVDSEEWEMRVRATFSGYPRSTGFWIDKFQATIASLHEDTGRAERWLARLLPQWHERSGGEQRRRASTLEPIPVDKSKDMIQRALDNPDMTTQVAYTAFLQRHRRYAKATGDAEFLVKTFCNLADKLSERYPNRAEKAAEWVEEALDWEPYNAKAHVVYSQVLWRAACRYEAIDHLWQARQRFPWNPVVRSELGRFLSLAGDLETAAEVYREAVDHFPNNPFVRAGLAETLRQMGQQDEALLQQARDVYEQVCRDFPNNPVCLTGFAFVLLQLDELDEAQSRFDQALDANIEESTEIARYGLAQTFFARSARTADEQLREKARTLFQEVDNEYARQRLEDFDLRWERASERGREAPVPEGRPDSELAIEPLPLRDIDEMSPAERLGRAMITLRHAEQADPGTEEKSAHANQARHLLALPDAEVPVELLRGYVVTRGLVLLARGDGAGALDYFSEQIQKHGRGGWLGVRLGYERARLLVGETEEVQARARAFNSASGQFAMLVVGVLDTLVRAGKEEEVADLLRELYPLAHRLSEREDGMRMADQAHQRDKVAGMAAKFVVTRWLEPADIMSVTDLDDPERLQTVIQHISQTQQESGEMMHDLSLAA